jgi:hypothetical protein
LSVIDHGQRILDSPGVRAALHGVSRQMAAKGAGAGPALE